MLGWLIILGVGIIIIIIAIILDVVINTWNDGLCGLLYGTGIGILIISIIMLIACTLEVKKEIQTFTYYQEIVETITNDEINEYDYALNLKIIELNEWLANAKASEDTYGIFSFYRNKIDDLEYIRIGD